MREIVRRAWIEELLRAVELELPNFKPQPIKRSGDAGMLRFVWHARPKLWCILAFRPLADESFDAFAGWSRKPWIPLARFFESSPEHINDFEAGCFVTWTLNYVPRTGLSYWKFWEPPESALDDPELFFEITEQHFRKGLTIQEARALVSPAVGRALDEVRKFCVPYLEKRVQYEDERQN